MNKKGTSFNFFDTLWKFFTSVRLTVVLLLTLAATSIIGTLIPQNGPPAEYVQKYGVEVFRIFSILDLTDMYHSWWFRFFMGMLTLNVVVCSLDRLPATLKIVFVKEPVFNVNRFRKSQTHVALSSARLPDDLIGRYAPLVSRWFGYSRIEKTDQGQCILAEKGRLSRLGFYLVHLSIVFLLLGGMIGSIYGFDGFVNIPEGESVGHVRLSNSQKLIPLDFQIQCDDFSVTFYETGQPKEYRSRLTLLEGDTPVLTQDIIVNQPLRYKGINIFQSSYGEMPPAGHGMASKGISLNFEDRETPGVFVLEAAVGRPVELPEGRGTFILEDVVDSYNFKGRMDLGKTLIGQLRLAGGSSTEVIIPMRFPKFDKMRQGRFVITLDEKTLGRRYYTGLQVTRDPGVWLVYLGFILLIAGCMVTFFMSHQRLLVEVVPDGTGSRVIVSGSANKNKLGMQTKVKKISERLAGAGN